MKPLRRGQTSLAKFGVYDNVRHAGQFVQMRSVMCTVRPCYIQSFCFLPEAILKGSAWPEL